MSETKTTKEVAPNSAFVAAEGSVDTRIVREMLKLHGVNAVTAEDAARPGALIVDSIVDAIRQTDFTVGLMGTGGTSGSVLFELGIARGLGKPTLMITAPET